MNSILYKFKNSHFIRLMALFLAYLITAKFGLELGAVNGFATLIWLPTGIAFAALTIFGLRLWPSVALAAFVVNLWTGAPLLAAVGMAVGNCLEALAGACLFARFVGDDHGLKRVSDVLVLFLLVAVGSTLISPTIGVLSLFLNGVISEAKLLETWYTWWSGDLISDLVVAPVLLVWSRLPILSRDTNRRFEGAVLTFIVLALSLVMFRPWFSPEVSAYIRTYWLFALLIWTTLRFGQHANVLFVLTVTSIAIWGTMQGYGPFQTISTAKSLVSLQLFLLAFSITGLSFGALGREREDALQARSDFVSIASHELKTPLTTLKLQVQVLKTGLDPKFLGPDAEKVLKIFSSTDQHLDRLTKLVDDLLDVSQLEEEKAKLELSELSLSELVSETAAKLHTQFADSGCSLELNVDPRAIGAFNQRRIEQVITNLLMNAIKYGPGKPIIVETKKLENNLTFTVKDGGIGIAKEHHKRIFRRFERVKGNYNVNGIGLGLYICNQIVQAHHGKILVESQPGMGATFTVRLPNSEMKHLRT